MLFGTRTKVAVLRALSATGTPLSQREIARRTRLTPRSIGVALGDLVATGVVHRHIGGREHFLALNHFHALVPALRAMFATDRTFLSELREALVKVPRSGTGAELLSVTLFGSVARAEETVRSDLDVLLIGRTRAVAEGWRTRYLEAALALQDRFGVQVSPIAYGLAEARRFHSRRAPPFPEMVRDGMVLVGSPLRDILEA